MKYLSTTLILGIFFFQYSQGQPNSQWRGQDRDGIYNESNLLKEWPAEGPDLLWFSDSLPKGYSSAAVDNQNVYLTGIIDSIEYVFALGPKGELLWKTEFGKAWVNYSDSRGTPTIEDDKIYVASGNCDIACVNKMNGEIIWKVEASEKYDGKVGQFGYSESLLIIGDKVFFTPGGDSTTMVAVNKHTGEEIWISASINDVAAYTSPIHIHVKGTDVILNVMESHLLGINADNGQIMFKTDYASTGNERSIKHWATAPTLNTNSPVFKDMEIYVTSGYDHSGVKFKLSDDLTQVSVVWIDSVLDVHHGATVLVDGYIYGANWLNNAKGNWCCINWETGETMYESNWETKGSIIYADGMLYCYDEKRGNIALVEPNTHEFKIISEFRISKGRGPHWSHLVINEGKLYVRHESTLMVYDIKSKMYQGNL